MTLTLEYHLGFRRLRTLQLNNHSISRAGEMRGANDTLVAHPGGGKRVLTRHTGDSYGGVLWLPFLKSVPPYSKKGFYFKPLPSCMPWSNAQPGLAIRFIGCDLLLGVS